MSVQVIVYPLGIPALYAWHLHRNRDKIDPDLPPIEGETPEALQMRKIKAREADKSLPTCSFCSKSAGRRRPCMCAPS